MTQQFTAIEVRDHARELQTQDEPQIEAAHMLTTYADLLEAREKAVPVGCLTVQRFRGSDAMVNHDFDYYGSLPDGSYSLYTQSQSAPADAERLAEALRHYCEQMETFQPQGELGAMHGAGMAFAYKDAAKTLRGLFAAHSAQAQPPAARVTGAVEVSFEIWQDDEMVAECSGPEPSALHEARHYAAQYSQDGAVKLFRVSRVAISAAQENPNG